MVEYRIRTTSFESEWYEVPENSPFVGVELAEQLAFAEVDAGNIVTGEEVFCHIRHEGVEVGAILFKEDATWQLTTHQK